MMKFSNEILIFKMFAKITFNFLYFNFLWDNEMKNRLQAKDMKSGDDKCKREHFKIKRKALRNILNLNLKF